MGQVLDESHRALGPDETERNHTSGKPLRDCGLGLTSCML